VGWNAIPEGSVSRHEGSDWLKTGATALLAVPSVIIDEEDNILINPGHAHSARIVASKIRRFVYDHRV
jgi:RES domain-containing protein